MNDTHLHDRRFVPQRAWDVKQLWEKHQEILRLLVLGHTNVEVAELLGCTPQTVSNIRNSPLAKEKLQQLGQQRDAETVDIAQRIKEFAPVALQLVEDIISGNVEASTGLRAKHAETYLSRAGYGPVNKSHVISTALTPEDIAKIKARAHSAAQLQGVLEVEFSEVHNDEAH